MQGGPEVGLLFPVLVPYEWLAHPLASACPAQTAHHSARQTVSCSPPTTHRSAHGFYPSILGPGNAAAKGRIPYTLLMIMDALRMFPGQVGGVESRGSGGVGEGRGIR